MFHSPVDHLLMHGLPVLAVALGPHLRVEALQRNSGDIHAAPHGHCERDSTHING